MGINEALDQLDPKNDADWTDDGFPDLEAMAKLMGTSVNREQITNARPNFSRPNPDEEDDDDTDPLDGEDDNDSDDSESKSSAKNMSAHEREAARIAEESGDEPDVLETPEEMEEEMAMLQARIKKGLNKVNIIRSEIKKLDKELMVITASVTEDQEKLEQMQPKQSNTENIRQYIKSQNELRKKKFANREKVLGNLDPKSFDPRSKIDQAMARKRGRGTERPKLQPRV